MKTKRSRKDYSEEESDEPDQSWPQRKSDSDMFESSDEEVSKKSKKRRKKRESSSESETEASDKDAHKKRKHKKKKRKHSKKKRKDASSDDSESDSDASSDESEEDSPVVVKKRHKHKHRHSGKHSKKRRHDSDRDVYPEKVSVSSERLVPSRATTSHKIKSVCMGKEQRPSSVENIVSSEEEQPRKRVDRREETDRNPVYKGRPEIKDVVDRQRVKHHPPRPQLAAQLLSKKGTEPPGPYYKDAPRTSQKDKFPAPPRERAYEAGKSRPDQYYDKNRDVKPREERPKEERVREPRSKEDIRPPRDDQIRDVRQRDMRPRDDRPRDDRPRDDRPRDDRPKDDRPRDDRPRDDRPKDDRPRDDRPKDDRPRDDRPKDDKLRDYSHKFPDNNYNRYGENRQTFDRNGGNKYQNEEQKEERYSGQSNPNYRGSRDNHNQGSVTREEANRPGTEGYNNRRGNNYQGQNYQRDIQRQDGGYEKNNDYHNPRNDQRGNNRFQEKGDYSAGNQNTRRFDVNERKPAVKREHSTSSIRDIKQERRSDSRRLGSKERPPRTEYKREDREESGATARSRPSRSRASPERDDGKHEWGKRGAGDTAGEDEKPAGDRDKPNFGLSGKLTEDRNTVNGVVLKYTEPPEARQPKRRWRFYPFKGDKALPILYIHRQSSFLLGRDRKVADIPLDHPSVSKQHAALQYRLVPFTRDDGSRGKRVRPYIIDLGSANGTFVNNKRIDPSKYVELLERDVVKFGFSQREYVLLHENSKDDGMDDDDVKQTGGASDEGKARVKEEYSN